MIASIHQPNFMPWYPFFQKIQASDVFIILQNCQWEKNNFQNRFNNEYGWNTMPVNKGLDPIVEKRYIDPHKNWQKIKDKNKKYRPLLNEFDECIEESLANTNVNIIKKICGYLEITTPIVLDQPTNLSSTERLVFLCKRERVTEYLSGMSGNDYMDLPLFDKEDIKVGFQEERTMIKKPILEVLYDEH